MELGDLARLRSSFAASCESMKPANICPSVHICQKEEDEAMRKASNLMTINTQSLQTSTLLIIDHILSFYSFKKYFY